MSNIDKQALRSTSDCDWFEDWFKREFHPDKTGPYIKEQLFFAVRAARAPLLDELEAAEKRIAELSHHLQSAHAFIEHTEAFGYEASNGILCCGDAQWNIDASKSALVAAGKGEAS
ncbi:TPA: hypothetical protein L3E74_000913 [Enterobacter hormaechei]|nr:hypothetical protein [Enterobacter hormaechei]HBN5131687.1 hypothetical protein [Enterobacter hormaechei]